MIYRSGKQKIIMKRFDCVVVGGGMVGAASALTLAGLGLTVAVVDKLTPKSFSYDQSYDLRVSAISLGSQYLLEELAAWQQLTRWRVCPYKRLGVSETPLSYTEFTAQSIDQNHLGHIIENRLIQLSLWQQIEKSANITLFCPEQVESMKEIPEGTELQLGNDILFTKLVVAADGAKSKMRTLAKIGCTGWDYQQSAMLINVKTELPQQDITWQQYFQTGPVAMLPLTGNHASLVWYHQRDEIKRLSALNNEALGQEINALFPDKLGSVEVIDKASFPLTRQHANQYQQGRLVLLGDAAHTINPMAGQGVNLGFKDVKALQQTIAEAIGNGESWFDIKVLARYEQKRRNDNLLMMTSMDALYLSFNHPSPLVKIARNVGLFTVNKLPQLKRKALAYACGL